MRGSPATTSSGLILEHYTKIKVLKVVISQIGEPSIILLYRIDKEQIDLQFTAIVFKDSSEMSSHPSITNVFIRGLFTNIGCNFLSSIRTSKFSHIFTEDGQREQLGHIFELHA